MSVWADMAMETGRFTVFLSFLVCSGLTTALPSEMQVLSGTITDSICRNRHSKAKEKDANGNVRSYLNSNAPSRSTGCKSSARTSGS